MRLYFEKYILLWLLNHIFYRKYPNALQGIYLKELVKHYDASYKKYGLGATEVYIFQNTVS